MAQTCSVCKSKWRSEIEGELVRSGTLRNIAKRYGCSTTALFRHKRGHLPKTLALAKQYEETLSSERLLAEMADLKARLLRGLAQAERAQSAPAFVSFAREVRQCLESYFNTSDRITSNKLVQAVADAGGLGQRIAAARQRRAELRDQASTAETSAPDPFSLDESAVKPI